MIFLSRVATAAEIISLADAHGVDTSRAGMDLSDTDYETVAYKCMHSHAPGRCQVRLVARMVIDETVEGACAEDGGFYDVFLSGEHRHSTRQRRNDGAESQAPRAKKWREQPSTSSAGNCMVMGAMDLQYDNFLISGWTSAPGTSTTSLETRNEAGNQPAENGHHSYGFKGLGEGQQNVSHRQPPRVKIEMVEWDSVAMTAATSGPAEVLANSGADPAGVVQANAAANGSISPALEALQTEGGVREQPLSSQGVEMAQVHAATNTDVNREESALADEGRFWSEGV